jgi:hypothetical protein
MMIAYTGYIEYINNIVLLRLKFEHSFRFDSPLAAFWRNMAVKSKKPNSEI